MRSLILTILTLGCVPPPAGETTTPPPQAPAPAAGGATCAEVADCFGGCADAACQEACTARGSPEAQAAVRAIASCAERERCADLGCMNARCAAEIAACANGAAPTSAATSTGGPTGGPVAAGLAVPDEEFIFQRSDGLTEVPPLTIVSRGRAVAMDGLWKDSLHYVTLEITGATYRLSYQASSIGGGVQHTETGRFDLEGSSVVLAPKEVVRGTVNIVHTAGANRRQETASVPPDAPRRWAFEGVMLAYQKIGDHSVHHVEGITIVGAAPTWAGSPSGTWEYTLRRAR